MAGVQGPGEGKTKRACGDGGACRFRGGHVGHWNLGTTRWKAMALGVVGQWSIMN